VIPGGIERLCKCGCGRSLEGRRSNVLYALPECIYRNRKRGSDADQWLYRIYDAEGGLLYVGVTNQCVKRFDQHGQERTWWRDVASITVEHVPDRGAVAAAELKAIQEENPRHNIAGKPADEDEDIWIDCDRMVEALTSDPLVLPEVQARRAVAKAMSDRQRARFLA
jgi:predicted GIY-YIG superfamily endonuclease